MKKLNFILILSFLFLAFILMASSVSAANCRYYTYCWDKPGTKDTCCRVVAICDTGVDVWVGCTDVGSAVSPPSDDETAWTTIVNVEHEIPRATPPIGHVDHGKEIQIPGKTLVEKLIEKLINFVSEQNLPGGR